MKKLYAPWRSAYLKNKDQQESGCPFCNAAASCDDTKHLVLARRGDVLIMLNRYPYNAGHILVIPACHEGDPTQLTPELRTALAEAVNESILAVRKALSCDGVNVGMNCGKASGGSIPEHLHWHILPRWQGDTSFLPTLANTKLISDDLLQLYEQLREQILSL